MSLEKDYEINVFQAGLCWIVRYTRGTKTPPKWLYQYSLKCYGAKDNLIRYFLHKYYNLPIGKYTWGISFAVSPFVGSIGAFCSIANDLHIAPNVHRTDYFTTWNTLVEHKLKKPAKHSIVVGNDVWIGANCTILSGVHIGDGAVLGAGSIVTKDVQPYAIMGGGVNKLLRFRFTKEICQKLQNSKWWDRDDGKIFKSFKYKDDVEKMLKFFEDEVMSGEE